MGGHHVHLLHEVLLAGGGAHDALAAALLGAIGGLGQALHVAVVGQRDHHVLLLDQVEHVDLALQHGDLRAARVGVLALDLQDLVLDDAQHHALVGQHLLVVGDQLLKLGVLGLDLVALQAGQALQAHVQYGLGLALGQPEAAHQAVLGVLGGAGGADQGDDLVDVVQRDQQALQDVAAGLGLVQVVLGPAADDVLLVVQVVADDLVQRQYLRLAVHQRQHDGAEGVLQLGVLVEGVQHHVGVHVALELDDDAHALPVGLVADVGDALHGLFVDHLGDLLDQLGLVDHVGDLGDHDALAVLGHLLDLALGPHHDAAAALVVGVVDAAAAQDHAAGGEVRALDVLHQVVGGAVGVVDHAHHAVDHLAQVVGRDVRGHAHGDARGAVHQQVREAAGHHGGLHQRLVEVRVEVHGLLVDVPHQLQRQLGKPRLGVSHGRRAVAVHGAEVALALHQQRAGGEVLRQAHHGVVDRAVAVGMVFTQHVAHDARGLPERLVRRDAHLVHRIQDAPVHGLQAVAHVGQRPRHDDRHGVGDEGFF